MEENQNLSPNPNPNPNEPPAPNPNPDGPSEVVLTAEQYDALLDRLIEAEEQAAARVSLQAPKGELLTKEDLASLVNPSDQDEPVNIDRMTPSQLASFIVQGVQANMVQPLLVQIEAQRIKSDIKDFIRENDIKDFYDHAEAIYAIASANPKLSMAQCYMLAKADVKKPAANAAPADRMPNSLPSNLPPRTRPRTLGDRSTFVAGPTGPKVPETRTDAARLVLEEMRAKGEI